MCTDPHETVHTLSSTQVLKFIYDRQNYTRKRENSKRTRRLFDFATHESLAIAR
jgi:hypothetical protein